MTTDTSFDAMTENLSAGGMFIRTDRLLPAGNIVTINFNIPNASHPSVTAKCEVVRNSPQGMAFQFKSLDFYTFANLKAFIKHKPLPYW